MKFRVQMKDPDALHDATVDAAKRDVSSIDGLDPSERKWAAESRAHVAREKCARWFDCGEYITVEIDTEAMTCVVVPCR